MPDKCPGADVKKHPCPDCAECQFCSDRRCDLCRGWLAAPRAQDSGGEKTGEN